MSSSEAEIQLLMQTITEEFWYNDPKDEINDCGIALKTFKIARYPVINASMPYSRAMMLTTDPDENVVGRDWLRKTDITEPWLWEDERYRQWMPIIRSLVSPRMRRWPTAVG